MARADLRDTVDIIHKTVIGREADITFIIDVDPKTALSRGLARNTGEDRFEDMGLEFQMALRKGFLELADENPNRCIIIDGSKDIETVAQLIMAAYKTAAP